MTKRRVTFHDMCTQMGIAENDLYNNKDNTQEEADDDDKSRIDTEEDVAEDVNSEGYVEMFEEKGAEDSDD